MKKLILIFVASLFFIRCTPLYAHGRGYSSYPQNFQKFYQPPVYRAPPLRYYHPVYPTIPNNRLLFGASVIAAPLIYNYNYAPNTILYFCESSQAFYPNVQNCAAPWILLQQ